MKPSDPLDKLDYYTLLGIKNDASETEIRSAFRGYARKYHPDRFSNETDEKVERATQIYRRGAEAIQILTDQATRKNYDEALKRGFLRYSEEIREQIEKEARAKEPPVEAPPIRTLEAQNLFRRAELSIKKNDFVTAWKALRAALQAEPDSQLLKKRFMEIDNKLRQKN